MLEIFLLEADEVLTAIAESLQQSRAAPSDSGPLTTIRRAFHTLKGSSRMVGLMQFGDAGWAFEQVLNKWLSEDQPGTPRLYKLIEAGHDLFSVWVARLHQDAVRRHGCGVAGRAMRSPARRTRVRCGAGCCGHVPRSRDAFAADAVEPAAAAVKRKP